MQHLQSPQAGFLDCSDETTALLSTAVCKEKAWLGNQIKTTDWLFTIDEQTMDEIHSLASLLSGNGYSCHHPAAADLPLLTDNIAVPRCRELFGQLKNTVDNGVGFAVIDKLPVDDYPTDTMAGVFWLLGQLIGRPVSQKHQTRMIYDVKNSGLDFGYGVRGSVTSVELNFHTDNAFGRLTPEYVGLFCRHPAKQGGISRFCSLYALHDQIEKNSPAALKRLYQPMYYDRQKEHADGAPPVTLAPFFSCRTTPDGRQRLRARANTSLVRKGYELTETEIDPALADALDRVDRIIQQPQFWFEAALEKGQLQYLNNHETGHYRSEFIDFDDPAKKRHLYRLWHRSEGHWSYDGAPQEQPETTSNRQ